MPSISLNDRRMNPRAPRRSIRFRWPLALLIAAGSTLAMMLLAMLKSGSCNGSIGSGCIDVPVGVLYALHGVAVVCCLWAIVGSLSELIDARRRAARSASGSTDHMR